uniref:F-box protein At3g26010-like beta-propeller domain-containing protein n=1 Tax=Setaria italica TaxID=4555 RepID=K4ALD8_SETIT
EAARHFTNVTGRGVPLIRPSLSFLPGYADINILVYCNGRLLCRSWTAAGTVRYVVCNPVTEQWAVLPASQAGSICTARLGFDPAVSPHFHAFEFVETDENPVDSYVFINGLKIYSSLTGEWTHRDSGWSDEASLCHDLTTVFLNGILHMFASAHQDVLAVDTEGKAWRTIPVPHGNDDGFIWQSLGCLYYLNTVEEHDFKLTVFVLEDYSSDEWIFKHSCYSLIAVHPECHLVYFISDLDNTIRCYDMDRRKVHVIRNLGCQRDGWKRCLPYVPLFSESFAGWN